VGPLISRVRDQAYDLTVHVRSPLPSHLPLPNPRISNRPAVRSVVETFGESLVSLPGPSHSYFGCFLHLIESASTPLDGASPLAPFEPVRASPLSAALTSSLGVSFPTHEAWDLVMCLRSTLCFRKGMVRRHTSS
jgi:hypothetical protein